MKPDFIVIGGAKCGTTTICRELERHPEVGFFPHKETHFFSFRYDLGLLWYEKLFEGLRGNILGEGSPTYANGEFSKLAAKRIASNLPKAKLIFIARHPIYRLLSAYFQLLDNGLKLGSFEEELKQHSALIPTSCFHARIKDYYDRFPPEAIHVMFLEDLKKNYQGELARLFEFIGVNPCFAGISPLAPQNTRAHLRRDSFLLRQARKNQLALKLAWSVPRPLKNALMLLLRKKITTTASWSSDLRQYAVEKIREDAERFLEQHGKPHDFWSWNQPV